MHPLCIDNKVCKEALEREGGEDATVRCAPTIPGQNFHRIQTHLEKVQNRKYHEKKSSRELLARDIPPVTPRLVPLEDVGEQTL